MVYRLTAKFPKEETYALGNQMRRAAVSITSNIAEGFSRTSPKDKLQFYCIAKGSLTEIESQALIARDLGYCTASDFIEFEALAVEVGKLVTGLQKSLR